MSEKFKVKSVKYNLLMNLILKMSGVIFPLITFPYVSRVLLSEANGKIAFATSVVSYFSLVASMGIPSYGVRKCAEVRDNKNELSKIVRDLLILNSIFTLLSYGVFIILLIVVPKFNSETPLFLISSITIIFNMLGVEWFYQAIEQYQYITVRNIAFKLLSIGLMFLFVHSPSDYIIYAGVNVFASVGSNILNIIKLHHYVDFSMINKKFSKSDIIIHLAPIITLFLYNATTVIFTSLDQVMLGFLKNSNSVGYYAATIKVKNILVSVVTALGAVMLPKVSYALKNESNNNFDKLITKSFEFIFISAIPIAFYFILMSKDIIIFLSGTEYMPSISILKLLMPSIIFIGLSSVTAWQLLIPLGMEKFTVYGAIIGALVNVFSNIMLIPSLGAEGAAISSSLAELAVLLVHFKVLKIILKRTFNKIELIKSLVSTVISFVISYLIMMNILNAGSFIRCLISGVIFFGSYIVLLLVLRENIVFDGYKMFINKYKERKNE